MTKTAKRPKKAKRKDLDLRQRKYVAGRLAGKSKKDSALEAGYSASMAKNAAARIESPDVRRTFQELTQRAVPMEKILKRLQEGLDAHWTYQDNKRRTVREVYFRERREHLILAAKFAGYYIDKRDIDLKVDEADAVARRQRLREILDRYVDMEAAKRMQAMKPPDKPAE